MDYETHQPDEVHERLKTEIERRTISYLWVPGDTPSFKPALLPTWYGDGRTLFNLATINQRPRYYVIRGDSKWGSGLDREDSEGPDFAELTDDLYNDLIEAFGSGRCGYSGSSLFIPKRERRMTDCGCEDCRDMLMARWPMIDDSGGCSWSRADWPKFFRTVSNPLSWRGNLLSIATNETLP